MNYRDWHVGMKVVCVKRGLWFCETGLSLPKTRLPEFEAVYTITGLDFDEEDGMLYVGLAGYGAHDGFEARSFRPVEPRKTDISIFTALLHTTKTKEPA